jgi:hypothetical protein
VLTVSCISARQQQFNCTTINPHVPTSKPEIQTTTTIKVHHITIILPSNHLLDLSSLPPTCTSFYAKLCHTCSVPIKPHPRTHMHLQANIKHSFDPSNVMTYPHPNPSFTCPTTFLPCSFNPQRYVNHLVLAVLYFVPCILYRTFTQSEGRRLYIKGRTTSRFNKVHFENGDSQWQKDKWIGFISFRGSVVNTLSTMLIVMERMR